MKRFIGLMIRVYRKTLGRILPDSCRFTPTCSEYALEAVRVHGALKGSLLAVRRICRCNPFFDGGYDPVPPKKSRNGKA